MPFDRKAARAETPPTVATVGVLDGVHLGHAELVRAARDLAARLGAARVVAMSFDPHPLTAIKPELTPARLSTWAQREAWLKQAGADEVVRLKPEPGLLHLDPAEFLARLRQEHGVVGMVEGDDFRFGKNRAGDTELLAWLGERMGIATRVVPPVTAALNDQSIVRASSSMIRWLLRHARVADAAILLGRCYEIHGVVEQGDRRGRTIGFPTANIKSDLMLPADGVYACEALARTEHGEQIRLPAAVNVGQRPTFAGAVPTLEAHLITGDGESRGDASWATLPGLPEYGWAITLRFVAFLREQVKFASIDALRAQLMRDRLRTSELVLRARPTRPDALCAAPLTTPQMVERTP